MDVLGEDQALQAVLGRGDFGGIDNEALDFSQLTDYINDDNDSNIYFHEALVGSDIKLTDSPTTTNKNNSSGGLQITASPTISSSNLERSKSHLRSGGGHSPHSLEGTYCPSISTSCGSPTISTTVQSFKGSNSLNNSSIYQQSHHLPDSPPDSGSEPPFSPPNEDHKLSGSNLNPSASHSRSSHHHNSSQPADAMMHSQAESLKHFIAYTSTQPLKHLPDNTSLTIDPHQHPVLQQLQPGLGAHHLTTTTSAGAVLTQLGQVLPQLGHGVNQLPSLSQNQAPLVSPSHLGGLYGSEEFLCDSLSSQSNNNPTKKRKLSESPKNSVSSTVHGNGMVNIKQEPDGLSPEPATSVILGQSEDEYSFDFNGPDTGMFMDSAYQCIRFQPFQPNTWHTFCDSTLKELPPPNYRVDADKGFNFSNADEAFVCQKKNHFQVTVHIQAFGGPQFIKSPEGLKKVESFYLHFHGAKVESPSQTIKVEQSQSDRSKKPFHPVLVDLTQEQVIKTTVGRLHFSETTSNNMRKKGKPNPDQRYFYLVVGLYAHIGDQTYPIVAHASERIIVRVTASNPGQFENDMELSWQKGHTPESIYHAGRVGINTDRPDESLVIHGNVRITGHIVQPSDARAKTKVQELDTKEQLKNVSNMKIVKYEYRPEFASQAGILKEDLRGTGVIAQEVRRILPDAVREAGDVILPGGEMIEKFLVVNKERIFMENVGAVKELCKVTDNLETRIDELERINSKLSKLKRLDSLKSTSSGSTVTSGSSSLTIGRKHNHRKHNSRRRTRQEESNNFCSNRLVQGTIVVLVLVMAFCLAAVASLYILEWQRRHSTISDAYLADGKILKSTTSHTTNYPMHYFTSVNSNQDFGKSGAKQQETGGGEKQTKILKESTSTAPHPIVMTETDSEGNANESISDTNATLPTTNIPTRIVNPSDLTPTVSIPILKPKVIGSPAECQSLSTLPSSCQVSCCYTATTNAVPQAGSNREAKTFDAIADTGYESINISRAGLEGRTLNLSVIASQSLNGEVSNVNDEYHIHSNIEQSSNKFGSSPHQELEETHQNNNTSYRHLRSDLDSPRVMHDVQDNSASASSVVSVPKGELDFNRSNEQATRGEVLTRDEIALRKLSQSSVTNQNQPASGQKRRSVTRSKRKKRDSRGQFSKSSTAKDLARSVESLKLMELNATVGPEYCNTWQCLHKAGPSFGYHVPISKYMNHEFITLQFNLATPLIVEHCEPKDKTIACSSPRNVPHGYNSPENNLVEEITSPWRLPVGLYLRSSYRFRIMSRSNGDMQPCSLSEEELGHSFIEYNLVFQRKCDK